MFYKSFNEENLSLKCALDEWDAAQTRFNTATEPEMIELAIYQMQSAQKRFVYLIKEKGEVQSVQ